MVICWSNPFYVNDSPFPWPNLMHVERLRFQAKIYPLWQIWNEGCLTLICDTYGGPFVIFGMPLQGAFQEHIFTTLLLQILSYGTVTTILIR